MFENIEQFAAANKASVDAMVSLAHTALNSAERITALNLKTANLLLEDGAANAKAMLTAKNLQDVMATQTAKTNPILDQIASYNRSYYEIMLQSKNSVTKVFENQLGEYQKQVSSFLDKAAQRAPAGSEVAVAAAKSAFTAVSAAFETMNDAVKKAGEIAEAHIAKSADTINPAPASNAGKKKST